VFLTVTSGPEGTAVYVNGVAAKILPQAAFLAEYMNGRLLLGDSPGQSDSWPGDILGLAVYSKQLTPSQVLFNYNTWRTGGPAVIPMVKAARGAYLFDEHKGALVRDSSSSGPNLYIPKRYQVMEKLFLEPPWSEFSMSRDYWATVFKNIAGCIPLGVCFCAWFAKGLRMDRPGPLTVVFGCLVSLTIEILQGFLPTRDSGMTDIITNTIGTFAGVIFYTGIARIVALHRKSESIASVQE
jgi:VanZ family protein